MGEKRDEVKRIPNVYTGPMIIDGRPWEAGYLLPIAVLIDRG